MELLTSGLKSAFLPNRAGEITLSLTFSESENHNDRREAALVVRDNGGGFPRGYALDTGGGFDLNLIRLMAAGGTLLSLETTYLL